jgi:hypothetical protein
MLPSIVASLVILALVQSAPLPLPRPASAPLREVTAWGPDSVVTLGGGISHYQPFWGLILPAPGGDLIAYWSKLDTNPLARVTRSGGIVFATTGSYTTTRLGVTVEASGDVLEAFVYSPYPSSGNRDIAFERTTPAGQGEAPRLAHDPTSFNELFPSAAAGPLGGVYIAWTRGSSDSPYFLQRVTSSGTIAAGWNPTGLRVRPPAGPSGRTDPALLPDGSGGVYMLASADVMRLWRVQSDTTLAVGWPNDGVPVSATRYDGGSMPSDLALVPGPAGHAFAVWVEVDNSVPTKTRVAMRSFDGNGNMDGPVVGLTPFTSFNNGANTIGKLRAQGDGQGGMLVRWQRGVVEFAHVLANGTVGAGPVPIPGLGGIVTSGPGGGYWVFWTDPAAMWEQLYMTDGTPVSEPQLLETPGYYNPWPMDAYPDGDGGAYLLSVGAWGLVQMRHFVPLNVADVRPRPRDSRIALVVAPNPARRELRLGVTLFGEQAASLELLDVAGRRVLTQMLPAGASVREERIALPSGLPSGVYLVSLRQGSRAAMRRVAIIQ